jgi:hypothetical protein
MQRSRRRKLLRAALRDPFLVQGHRGRDQLRRVAYQGLNRATRRSLIAKTKETK